MYININGKITEEQKARISPSNRSFRYGDGCFETMRVINGKIALQQLHMQRLFSSIDTLQFTLPAHFSPAFLVNEIIELAAKNKMHHCRVRLAVYRGDGGLYDPVNLAPNFIIQTYELASAPPSLNDNGLVLDIFRESIKAADHFSSIKSNNFLPYVMAALWAKKHQLNDALLLNQFGRIADSTIANVFLINNGKIKTPALTEGGIAGVMRTHLLSCFRKDDMPVVEDAITLEELLNASEVFLTNAIHGIKWVKQIGNSNYTNDMTRHLYKKFVNPLFNA